MDELIPSDDMTDRDIILTVQRELTAIYDRMLRGQADYETDVLEPLNEILVFLEDATHPERPNPTNALVNAALDSLASGVLAASLDDAVTPFLSPPTA